MVNGIWPAEPEFKSKGEKKFFDALKNCMKDGDQLIVGLKFRDDRLRHIDIDFLFIRPSSGVLVIEVKGGNVKFDVNRNDWLGIRGKNWEPLGVYEQIMKEHGSFKRLITNVIKLNEIPSIEYAVAFPETVVNDTKSLELKRSQIIDALDLRKIDKKINSLFSNSQNKIGIKWVNKLVNFLKPFQRDSDIDFSEKIFQYLDLIDVHTQKTLEILNKVDQNPRIKIIGAAGTGKTWLAMDLAKKWSEEGLRVAILVSQNSLQAHYEWFSKDWKVLPFWIGSRDTFHNLIQNHTIGNDNEKYLRYCELRRQNKVSYLTQLFKNQEVDLKWDALIIDESQDINNKWFEILNAIVDKCDKVAIFGDLNQKFGRGDGYFPSSNYMTISLNDNVRSGGAIVEICNRLVGQDTNSSIPFAYRPSLILCKDTENISKCMNSELKRLIESERWKPGQIAVLHPLRSRRFEPNIYHIKPRWNQMYDEDSVIQVSIDGFRGLEREVVIVLIDNFDFQDQKHIRRLYTAISRAKLKLIIISEREMGHAIFEKSLELFDVSER